MIYKAIADIMAEIGAIGKNQRNSTQGFMYRGVDIVMNTLNPSLVRHKVFVVPEVLEQTREERQTSKGGTLLYSICRIKFTFYAEDGSSVSAITIGEGMDSGDKATNKAMSIAFKYACFQVFCIPTEEMIDPDGDTPAPSKKKVAKEVIDEAKVKALNEILENKGITKTIVCKLYKVNELEELTENQHANIVKNIDKIKEKQEAEKKNE
jgi:hypothetical protein